MSSPVARLRVRSVQVIRSPTAKFSLGRLIPAALTVLSTPILARLIDRQEFGQLALLQTIALLVGAACFGWAEVLIVRLFASAGEIRESELSALARPAVFGSVLVVLSGLAVSIVSESAFAVLTALCAVSYALTLISTALGRARQDPVLFVGAATIGLGSRFLIGIPLVAMGSGIAGILVVWMLGGIAAIMWTARRLKLRWRSFSLPRVEQSHVRFAGPVVAVSSGLLVLALADRLILSVFVPASELAPYALGYSLVDQAASLAFSILLATQFPTMVRTYDERGEAAAQIELTAAIARFLKLTVLPILLLALFGGQVARAFGGPQYLHADFRFMPFVAGGLLLNGLHQYLSVPSQQRRATGTWAMAVTLGVVVNVGANFLLIPAQGTFGAGISTLLGYGTVVSCLLVRDRSRIVLPFPTIGRQAVAVAAAIAATELLRGAPWVLAAALVAILYAGVSFAPLPRFRVLGRA